MSKYFFGLKETILLLSIGFPIGIIGICVSCLIGCRPRKIKGIWIVSVYIIFAELDNYGLKWRIDLSRPYEGREGFEFFTRQDMIQKYNEIVEELRREELILKLAGVK